MCEPPPTHTNPSKPKEDTNQTGIPAKIAEYTSYKHSPLGSYRNTHWSQFSLNLNILKSTNIVISPGTVHCAPLLNDFKLKADIWTDKFPFPIQGILCEDSGTEDSTCHNRCRWVWSLWSGLWGCAGQQARADSWVLWGRSPPPGCQGSAGAAAPSSSDPGHTLAPENQKDTHKTAAA